ncbi:hypothetical protein LVJ94_28830 [Pendulispora rubella]|uniref:Uncharacterized protein n=1 Tax=Pendulispora rubella TaxID=2741070 RepID=A0ABZ2KVC3_9BACT
MKQIAISIAAALVMVGCASSDGNVGESAAENVETDQELAADEQDHGVSLDEGDTGSYVAKEDEDFLTWLETTEDDPAVGIEDGDDLETNGVDVQAAAAVTPLLKSGLHRRASTALRNIKLPAWRIMQTCGNAPASKGSHAKDGSFKDLDGKTKVYCAAVDISTRTKPGGPQMAAKAVKNVLFYLGKVGFAAWYRDPGHDGWPSNEVHHIHAVYAGVPMKAMLDRQVLDYSVCKNGLQGHAKYAFYCANPSMRTNVKNLWNKYN